MTTYELLSQIETFLTRTLEASSLRETIRAMGLDHRELMLKVGDLLESSDTNTQMSRIANSLGSLTSSYRKLGSRRIFREVDELNEAVDELNVGGSDLILNESMKERLNTFADSFEMFLQVDSIKTLIDMLNRAREADAALTNLLIVLNTIHQGLAPTDEPENANLSSLSLVLQPKDELRIIVAKTNALEKIYEETCMLLKVSTSQFPLVVGKIESGSPLWTKLFGESKVIKLVTDLIREGVNFLYRNFTTEGQLGAIPRKVDELEAVLNLENRMRELGYDTTSLRESNRKSGAVIAKELNTLLSGETNVAINEEVFSLSAALDRRIATERDTLLLEEGDQSKTDGDA